MVPTHYLILKSSFFNINHGTMSHALVWRRKCSIASFIAKGPEFCNNPIQKSTKVLKYFATWPLIDLQQCCLLLRSQGGKFLLTNMHIKMKPCPTPRLMLGDPLLTHWGRDKWTPCRRRHFQMHFLELICLNSDSNFIEVCSQGSN